MHLLRHVSTQSDMHNVDARTLRKTTQYFTDPAFQRRKSCSNAQVKRYIHDSRLCDLIISWHWRQEQLQEMSLKTLILGLESLFCPDGCCRVDILERFATETNQRGPWYRLEPNEWCQGDEVTVPDIETKCRTRVVVQGLRGDEEKQMLHEIWRLEVVESSGDDK